MSGGENVEGKDLCDPLEMEARRKGERQQGICFRGGDDTGGLDLEDWGQKWPVSLQRMPSGVEGQGKVFMLGCLVYGLWLLSAQIQNFLFQTYLYRKLCIV